MMMILRGSPVIGALNNCRDDGGGLEDDRRRLHGIVVGRAGVLPHVHHRVLWGRSSAAVVVALHRPFGRAALLRAPGAPVVTPACMRACEQIN